MYSELHKFRAGMCYLVGVPFALPHVVLYGDWIGWVLALVLLLYIYVVYDSCQFLLFLFKNKGKEGRGFVFTLCATIIVLFLYSLLERHPFPPFFILIWILFFSIYLSGRVFKS